MWERYIYLINKYPFIAVSDVITLCPLLIGIISYKYLSKENKLLFYFIIVHFLLDLQSVWISVKNQNNLNIFNFTELLEVTIICLVFLQLNSQYFKKWLIAFLLFTCVFVGIWKFDFAEFAFVPYVLNRLSYVIVVFIYFNTLLSETSVKNILTHPPFWLCAGLIVYSTGSVIIFLFGKQILASDAPHEKFVFFYSIISIINIFFRLLICVSFFVSKYEKK
ncbi:hypothetical protein EMA8858_00156 [Emticicia aquatica]|jgi:hypothetical protein|uniref:Uncharacterized protein n=1 Tax=Emticicia aquatica TaxID=1681835 RepID=A0ABM9ALD9_9BACT|nr:hypothetical protein EMA8858_00156 [Emticicia aquatica]